MRANYEQAVRYLFSLLGSIRKDSFGLHRIERLMAELDHPERLPGIVHIAGTNGKGSTGAMIEAGLLAAGRSTGFYSSPHLNQINERFRLNGKPASNDATAQGIEEVQLAIERIVAQEGRSAHPTFFEATTAIALCIFRRAEVAHPIIEVGLGGRLDASNVVKPQLAVITRIAFDHESFLGPDLATIAAEKAAIIKAGAKAVIGLQDAAANQVLVAQAQKVGVNAIGVETSWQRTNCRPVGIHYRFDATQGSRTLPIQLSLAGQHQVENALAAIAALDALDVPSKAIQDGLANTVWPGRLELVSEHPKILLDAAHNPSGARALAEFLAEHVSERKVVLVYGSSREKAVDEVAGWLFPQADQVVLTRPRLNRALRPETLREITGHHHRSIQVAGSLPEALGQAKDLAGSEGWIVIAGSIFLVGEARAILLD